MTTSPFLLWLRGQFPALIVAFVVLATAGVVKWESRLMPEDTYVPSPVMPSPNARDMFTAAEGLMRGTTVFTQVSIVAGSDTWLFKNHILTQPEKEKLVVENFPAVAKLREGLKYPYMSPPVRSFSTLFPYYRSDREMARLLSLTGQTRAARGDWSGAMDVYLDAMKLGADLPRGAIIIGTLCGIGCEDIARGSAYGAVDHLSAAQARAAALRLAKISANEVTPAETLREQENSEKGSLLQMFREQHKHSRIVSAGDTGGDEEAVRDFELRMESPRMAYDNFGRYMDELVATKRMPWLRERAAKRPAQPTDPFNQILLPVFDQFGVKLLVSTAMDRLLAAQLALRAYRLDHGRYPAALSDLVPGYLPSVPMDPLSDNQALRYRLSGSGYVLYSIGPDAVDNGGEPIAGPKPHQAFSLDANTPGDIVAGANLPLGVL